MFLRSRSFAIFKNCLWPFIFAFVFLCLGRTESQTPSSGKANDMKARPYSQRLLARGFGNVGRWWSLMGDNDKAAFMDGFILGMEKANQNAKNICEVMRQDLAKDANISLKEMSQISFVCSTVTDTSDYDKESVKDVDEFYAELPNQEIPVNYALEWLRDRARGSKTKEQLVDTLNVYQQNFKIKP